MNEHTFEHNGELHQRRWFLTGEISALTSNQTWYSTNEVLDPRPINQIFAILEAHYSDPDDAIKLLKKGNIVHLGECLRDCVFDGPPRAQSREPEAYCITQHNIFDDDACKRYYEQIKFIRFYDLRRWLAPRDPIIKPWRNEEPEHAVSCLITPPKTVEPFTQLVLI
ncbi:hypothetical protein [Pseudoalteromonas ulvae]|uniref:Uncharacterized protein n=1 Tax=Pseudoalteromonas ulvae TaxID=107327 RepID=A0A244CV10_PSEDV|nr:hypothetical protein [Pseudoalteromonas ulvae]OUL59276.1 hypothetical protein B1199_03125 [Pseudoalteromonas ulvae]